MVYNIENFNLVKNVNMKNPSYYLLIILVLMVNAGCKKEKICSSIPEGPYEGWFTDEGADAKFTSLYLNKVDDNTFVINTSNDTTYGPYMKRNECSLGGIIEGKSCIGEIKRKKGKYIIEGTYSYLANNGGLGNPNPQYYEVHGTFEIKSN